ATDTDGVQADVESAVSGPSATTASESNPDAELTKSAKQPASALDIPEDRGGKKRGGSPGQRFKNAFSSSAQDKKDTESNRERSSSTSSKKNINLFRNSDSR